MQDLVAEYQQYQDATYVHNSTSIMEPLLTCVIYSVEEEGEYEEEVVGEEE